MDTALFSLIISGIALLIALAALLKKTAKTDPVTTPISRESVTLKLQAYERLVLLTERIALPNLIGRLNQTGISAYEMKLILTENIKAEFDYNSTQQLYVTPVCWDAVRNLKEQNIMIGKILQMFNSLNLRFIDYRKPPVRKPANGRNQ